MAKRNSSTAERSETERTVLDLEERLGRRTTAAELRIAAQVLRDMADVMSRHADWREKLETRKPKPRRTA